jgi:hypothetical protein
LLLVLALLLWPLDIALRRVSIGRRDFAAAGAWVRDLPRRRRATAARTATGESLLAARGRATSTEARAALRRAVEPAPPLPAAPPAQPVPHEAPPAPQPAPRAQRPVVPATTEPAAAPAGPAVPPAPAAVPAPPAEPADTLSRLRDAKRRARER